MVYLLFDRAPEAQSAPVDVAPEFKVKPKDITVTELQVLTISATITGIYIYIYISSSTPMLTNNLTSVTTI